MRGNRFLQGFFVLVAAGGCGGAVTEGTPAASEPPLSGVDGASFTPADVIVFLDTEIDPQAGIDRVVTRIMASDTSGIGERLQQQRYELAPRERALNVVVGGEKVGSTQRLSAFGTDRSSMFTEPELCSQGVGVSRGDGSVTIQAAAGRSRDCPSRGTCRAARVL